MKQTFDFKIEHMYRISVDESVIDAALEHWEPSTKEGKSAKEQQLQRLHRMFRALTSNPKVFSKVMVYRALYEHFIESQETFRFHEQEFGDNVTFGSFLLTLGGCLHPDDRAWLAQRVKKEQEQEANRERLHQQLVDPWDKRFEGLNYDLDGEIMPLILALGGNDYHDYDEYKGTEVIGWDIARVQYRLCEKCAQEQSSRGGSHG